MIKTIRLWCIWCLEYMLPNSSLILVCVCVCARTCVCACMHKSHPAAAWLHLLSSHHQPHLHRTHSKRGSDYTEVPQGCTQTPYQYGISVISLQIIIPCGAAQWPEGMLLLTLNENHFIKETTTISVNKCLLANVFEAGGDMNFDSAWQTEEDSVRTFRIWDHIELLC